MTTTMDRSTVLTTTFRIGSSLDRKHILHGLRQILGQTTPVGIATGVRADLQAKADIDDLLGNCTEGVGIEVAEVVLLWTHVVKDLFFHQAVSRFNEVVRQQRQLMKAFYQSGLHWDNAQVAGFEFGIFKCLQCHRSFLVRGV
ncbi:hypothetical protein D3C86_1330270 [compost metagenome]